MPVQVVPRGKDIFKAPDKPGRGIESAQNKIMLTSGDLNEDS